MYLFALAWPILAAAGLPLAIETEVYVEGKLISSPRIVMLEGASADMNDQKEGSYDHLKLHVESLPAGSSLYNLKYKVDYSSGKKQLVASPQFNAALGEFAEVVLKDKDGREELRLKVRATKEER